MSVYCFITAVICIILEAPDWMRYLSDNRSPDNICKLAIIAVPGLNQGREALTIRLRVNVDTQLSSIIFNLQYILRTWHSSLHSPK